MPKLLWTLLLFAAVAFSTACKGCSPDACEGVTCGSGQTCEEGICIGDPGGCDPACGAEEVCQAGQCVSLEPQCTDAGEECDASLPVNDGFVCLDLDGFGARPGTCAPSCDPDGSCALGSLCFYLGGQSDTTCTAEADCGETADCVDGICRDTVCRPSECEDFVDGVATCDALYGDVPGFETGTQCYDVGNGAKYCYPAGGQALGEACTDAIEGIVNQQFANTCQSGLACVDSVCQLACKDDAVCSGDQECILESEDFVDDGVGVCGDACAPFQSGSCGTAETCLPVSAEEGVCVPAGDKQAFDSCVPGAGECTDGTLCVTFQNTPQIAHCQPVCNITAGPANDDGTVGDFAQSQRDATCPQPDIIEAYLSFTNLAELGGAVDIYLGDEMTPTVAGLALDDRSDGDDQAAGPQWLTVEPGTYAIAVLPEGAPRTDPPLAETNINISAEGALSFTLLPVDGATDEVQLLEELGLRDVVQPAAGAARVRPLAGLADVASMDVLLVPPGDDLSDSTNQTELADDLAGTEVGSFTEVEPGDYDVLVFGPADPRTDRLTALYTGQITVAADTVSTLALRGTIDPDDLPIAGHVLLSVIEAPALGTAGPAFTCVSVGNDVYGFCQQRCPGDGSGFGGEFCEGDGLGCHPTQLDSTGDWQNLCAPLGELTVGDPCDPFDEFSGCDESSYCLEYGNTIAEFDAANRGRCVSYCVEEQPDNPMLRCPDEQTCAPISVDADYTVGRCGYPCEPDGDYTDDACPAGLQSCKPNAALVDDVANPDQPPTAVVQPSFCSASGDIAADTVCSGSDCVPGTECMFPRSEQTGFTSTLVSQYFGGPGLSPSCEPQCDPFDGDSAPATCGEGETCLFNFPWSAEVGHCAEIVEERAPLEGCSFPGQSCGEDSICVISGGSAACLQFCQYAGPDPSGDLQPETCTAGFLCAPLVADIGVCLSPT